MSHSAVVTGWRQRERELIASGDEVMLLTAHRWDEGGAVVALHAGADDFVHGVDTLGTHPNLFLYSPGPIWRALGQHWDIVDVHEEPYSLAAVEFLMLRWLRGVLFRRPPVPFVLYSAQNVEKRYPPPFRWTERWALRQAAGLSVCNQEAGRIAISRGLRGAVELIGLGVDVDRFHPALTRTNESTANVGFVGRLADRKGVHILLEALASNPRLRATIVGSGPAEGSLRGLADRLGLSPRVSFLGHRDDLELPGLYRTFDAVAIPSIPVPGWLEQFCRVAVEAMATGVPVVASRSGALPDVTGTAGLLVEPGDPLALSLALETATGGEADRLRAEGQRRAQEFSWPRIAAKHRELYRRAIGHPPSGSAGSVWTARLPGLEIAVIAYGSPDALADALQPVAGRWPITVIDNSSSTEVRTVAREAGATYIDAGANLGFASGVNLALDRRTPGRDLLLLNPDAVVDPDTLIELHTRLHKNPWLAAVSPAQIDGDGGRSVVTWPFPTPLRAWTEAFGFGRLQRPEFVIGAVLLLRSEAIDQVGRFDERFFLYSEETDWERRAVNGGWQLAEFDDLTAQHAGAGTSTDPSRRETHFHASQERYYRKHHGRTGWWIARAAIIFGSIARLAVLSKRRSAHAARLRLYVRGPVQCELRMRRAAR